MTSRHVFFYNKIPTFNVDIVVVLCEALINLFVYLKTKFEYKKNLYFNIRYLGLEKHAKKLWARRVVCLHFTKTSWSFFYWFVIPYLIVLNGYLSGAGYWFRS